MSAAADSRDQDDSDRAPNADHLLVLLVDDDSSARQAVANLLREIAYDVIEVADAPDAIDVVTARSDIDLLLTEIMLRGSMSGIELAERCRNRQPEIAVLFMTAGGDEAAKRAGDFTVLRKPFFLAELEAAIARTIQLAESS